jgi:sec-independent protein translocase protein TatA
VTSTARCDILQLMHLGLGETLVVLVVALLVFGPNKLPQLGDALGKGIRNFKKAANDDSVDVTPAKPETRRLTEPSSTVSAASDTPDKTRV